MSFLSNLFGRKDPKTIVTDLMMLVVEQMADGKSDPCAPEMLNYLRDKKTPYVIASFKGCDSLLAQQRASPASSIINPQVIIQVREALRQELNRRG